MRSNNLGVESNQAITLLLEVLSKRFVVSQHLGPSKFKKGTLPKNLSNSLEMKLFDGGLKDYSKIKKFTAFVRCVRRWEADLFPKMRVGGHQGGNACCRRMLL